MRRYFFSACEKYVTAATAPCGTSFVSMKSAPGTCTRLQTLLFDSLVAGLRGSMTDTPLTLKLYRYDPGGSGPTTTSQTPLASFVIGMPWMLRGMSVPTSRTSSARGAKILKATRPSADTSGDVTCGGAGAACAAAPPRCCADGTALDA